MSMKRIVGIGIAVGGASAYLKGMMAGSGMKKAARKKTKAILKNATDLAGDLKYMFR